MRTWPIPIHNSGVRPTLFQPDNDPFTTHRQLAAARLLFQRQFHSTRSILYPVAMHVDALKVRKTAHFCMISDLLLKTFDAVLERPVRVKVRPRHSFLPRPLLSQNQTSRSPEQRTASGSGLPEGNVTARTATPILVANDASSRRVHTLLRSWISGRRLSGITSIVASVMGSRKQLNPRASWIQTEHAAGRVDLRHMEQPDTTKSMPRAIGSICRVFQIVPGHESLFPQVARPRFQGMRSPVVDIHVSSGRGNQGDAAQRRL